MRTHEMHGGRFVLGFGGEDIILPNTQTLEGAESFLKMQMRADVTDVAAGGNFYIGLCNQVPTVSDTLASITTEPGATGGYARQAVTRDAIGWPSISTVNGLKSIRSIVVTFAASGADFDTAFTRLFLCNVASGSAGILYSYSAPLSVPTLITDGTSFQALYEIFRG